MGDLRDAISRNNLKLPDLSEPFDFLRGDRLLRADRRLALASTACIAAARSTCVDATAQLAGIRHAARAVF